MINKIPLLADTFRLESLSGSCLTDSVMTCRTGPYVWTPAPQRCSWVQLLSRTQMWLPPPQAPSEHLSDPAGWTVGALLFSRRSMCWTVSVPNLKAPDLDRHQCVRLWALLPSCCCNGDDNRAAAAASKQPPRERWVRLRRHFTEVSPPRSV